METADVVVVGLGAMGAATIYQLACRHDVSVIGIDRFRPPHARGSTHGDVRVTRLAVAEGDEYVPFVQRTHAIWRELEQHTPRRLLEEVGCLMIAPKSRPTASHGGNFVVNSLKVARNRKITHEELDEQGITARFPQFQVREPLLGYYEPQGGFVRPEACIEIQLKLAQDRGARLRLDTKVLKLRRSAGSVVVETDKGPVQARHVVVATGAWLPNFVGGAFRRELMVQRQVQFWFEAADMQVWHNSPVFVYVNGTDTTDLLYGFPPLVRDGVAEIKIASEEDNEVEDPDQIAPSAAAEHEMLHKRHIAPRLSGIGGFLRATTCLYTMARDKKFRFRIDAHPEIEGVTVVSACSGHGFKHSAAIGEALARQIRGEPAGPELDLSVFNLDAGANPSR
jgi:sarcosine oxidase